MAAAAPAIRGRADRLGSKLSEARLATRFFGELGPFLGRPVEAEAARRSLERQHSLRERSFIALLREGVFGNPASPYRALLRWAGVELGDVIAETRRDGIEATLGRLHAAGVHLSLEEFKGHAPLARPGLELPADPHAFDNPLGVAHYEARTGGSNGASRRIMVDLGLLAHESAYHALFLQAAGIARRPVAIWHPGPPGAVGIKMGLIQAKLGRAVERWFSPTRLGPRYRLFIRFLAARTRRRGVAIPVPEFTPAAEAGRVARWLAAKRASGEPAVLITGASNGVRVCVAAIDAGLDISGSFFLLGGEPYTPAKAAIVASTGSGAASHYAMAEAGAIGIACAKRSAIDEVHLVSDKIATIEPELPVGDHGRRVRALFHTTLLLSSPKLMLNVESGDYASLGARDCGCGALPGSFGTHLHTIRSYEKLTSEGMSFLGGDLFTLLEEVLPARFGGHPTDYQLVEGEHGGLPRVRLLVRPAVGRLDCAEVGRSVLEFLRSRGEGERMMAQVWEQAETLRVVREEPQATEAAKILPLQRMAA